MAKKNSNLHQAKKAKNDEFYTQLPDIERELSNYKEHFRGKTVLCNCDDPRISNFFHYFAYNFEHLGLKRLITTCYKSQDMDLFSTNTNEQAIWLEYLGDKNGDKIPSPDEIGIHYFKGDGDFRSAECIELLKQADIVVTNPPFSLFREYVAQLIEYDKKFLIIGNMNAVTYQEIFPLLKENKIWLGYGANKTLKFAMPDSYEKWDEIINGVKYGKVPSITWFTNLEHNKRNEKLVLYKTYNSTDYPKYDNYDAIEVSKVADIPYDYDGIMGVPITFLDKYNPNQFEIIGLVNSSCGVESGFDKDYSHYVEVSQEGKPTGATGKKTIGNPMLIGIPSKGNYYINTNGKCVYSTYARILIRKIKK